MNTTWESYVFSVRILGVPVEEARGVDLHWTWQELNQFICSRYPLVNLDVIGFHFAKADKHRRLCRLDANTLKKLKTELADNTLYIVPQTNIALNEV